MESSATRAALAEKARQAYSDVIYGEPAQTEDAENRLIAAIDALARAEPIAAAQPCTLCNALIVERNATHYDQQDLDAADIRGKILAERIAAAQESAAQATKFKGSPVAAAPAQPPALPERPFDPWRERLGLEVVRLMHYYRINNGDEIARTLGALLTEQRAALSQEPPALPEPWRLVIKRARDGLAAGSRSKSNTDWEMEYGGALIDSIEEGLERAALSQEPKPGCGYPYCGGNAPECATCGRAALSQERPKAAEPESRVPDEAALQRLTERGAVAWAGHEPERQERAAPQPVAWVPVSEREPEQSGEYLCVSNLGFGVHRFAAGMGVWSEHHGEDITHWMPLPKPPESTEGQR